jgi:hypothetical protein
MLIPGVIGRHELFHLAVLAGIALHWQFIYRIASGEYQCPALRQPRGERQVIDSTSSRETSA